MFGVGGKRKGGVSNGGDDDSGHAGEGGGSRSRRRRQLLVAVEGGAGEEDGDGDGEAEGGKGIANGPADVVLDVNEDGVGKQGAEEDAEEPPVEEGQLLELLFWVELVELVGSNGGDVGFGSAGSDGQSVERTVEHG